MDARDLRHKIEDWTRDNCGHEPDRAYLGMSQIWKCEAELYNELMNGREQPRIGLGRLFYEGNLHHRDMIERLEGVEVYEPGVEVIADWDPRFQGHTDGVIGEDLLEIKSTTAEKFEEVRKTNRALWRHYEQVQMYLLYGGWERAIVIYKCRESGELRPIVVWPHERTQERLVEKARRVLEAVDQGKRPVCECGRHEG